MPGRVLAVREQEVDGGERAAGGAAVGGLHGCSRAERLAEMAALRVRLQLQRGDQLGDAFSGHRAVAVSTTP